MFSLALTLGLFLGRPVLPPANFHIVLDRTRTGWAAHCDSGCSWIDLSADCLLTCRATINSDGVTVGALKADTARFSFVVEKTAAGWTAVSLNGTAWTTLSWGCAVGPCKARLDGFGVSGLVSGKH